MDILEDITLGPVRLILGDCLKIAPTLTGIDAVVTDPPYGMDWNTDSTRFTGGEERHKRGMGRADYGKVYGDAVPFDPEPWKAFAKCVLFGANHFAAKLETGTTLVWVKKHEHLWGSFLSDAEIAWMKGGHGVYLFKCSFPPPARAKDIDQNCKSIAGVHPTQKPIALMAWCMDMAKVGPDETVLDPYMGSGTTLIAAMRTGRKAVGIEIDPRHYRTAVERARKELQQLPIAAHSNPRPAVQQSMFA